MIFQGGKLVAAPSAYQDWLILFEFLKTKAALEADALELLSQGTFTGSRQMMTAFHNQLTDTINEMLNKRIKVFIKELNLLIELNELADIVPLFRQLRNELQRCLFFKRLWFLDEEVRTALTASVEGQVIEFWSNTVRFLQKQNLEYHHAELEDALFLINRIRLFDQSA